MSESIHQKEPRVSVRADLDVPVKTGNTATKHVLYSFDHSANFTHSSELGISRRLPMMGYFFGPGGRGSREREGAFNSFQKYIMPRVARRKRISGSWRALVTSISGLDNVGGRLERQFGEGMNQRVGTKGTHSGLIPELLYPETHSVALVLTKSNGTF